MEEEQWKDDRIDSVSYFDSIRNISEPERFTSQEQEILAKFMETKVGKKAMRHMNYQFDAWKQYIFEQNFVSPEGMGAAVKAQGTANGMIYAIQFLIEIVNKDLKEDLEEVA